MLNRLLASHRHRHPFHRAVYVGPGRSARQRVVYGVGTPHDRGRCWQYCRRCRRRSAHLHPRLNPSSRPAVPGVVGPAWLAWLRGNRFRRLPSCAGYPFGDFDCRYRCRNLPSLRLSVTSEALASSSRPLTFTSPTWSVTLLPAPVRVTECVLLCQVETAAVSKVLEPGGWYLDPQLPIACLRWVCTIVPGRCWCCSLAGRIRHRTGTVQSQNRIHSSIAALPLKFLLRSVLVASSLLKYVVPGVPNLHGHPASGATCRGPSGLAHRGRSARFSGCSRSKASRRPDAQLGAVLTGSKMLMFDAVP